MRPTPEPFPSLLPPTRAFCFNERCAGILEFDTSGIQATDRRGAKMPQKLDGDKGQPVQRKKNGPEDRGHSTKVGFRIACRNESSDQENAGLAAFKGRREEGRRCGSRSRRSSSATGRWSPSGGRTGCWRASSQWKQSWTLCPLSWRAAVGRLIIW